MEPFAVHEGAGIVVRQRLATVNTLRAIDDRHHPAPATRTDRGGVEVKTPVEEPGGDLAHVAQGCSAHEREAGVAEGVPRRVEEQLSGERGGGHARRVSQGEPASARGWAATTSQRGYRALAVPARRIARRALTSRASCSGKHGFIRYETAPAASAAGLR